MTTALLHLICWLSLAGDPQFKNPWTSRVEPALNAAEAARTVASIAEAFDVAYRADNGDASAKLVAMAEKLFPKDEQLLPRRVRALWRGGRILAAEELAKSIAPDTRDAIALAALVTIEQSRGNESAATKLAERLLANKDASAAEHFAALTALMQSDRLAGFAPRLHAAADRIKAENGYPDIYLLESIDGLPAFFDAVGDKPLNQITHYGSAPMPLAALVSVPTVDLMIGDHGPYKFVVDTGGSIVLSINQSIADEAGVKALGSATIRGIGGSQESKQALVDQIQIGDIEMRRVVARTFDMPPPLNTLIGGIIGTGIFQKGRMTLDFVGGRLILSESSENASAGSEHPVRLIGDAKIVVPIKAEGEESLAIVDSGAEVIAVSPKRLKRWFPERAVVPLPMGGMGVGEGGGGGMNLAPGITIDIFGSTRKDVGGFGLEVLDTMFAPILGVDVPILVGMPLLREMDAFTVDFQRCRLWVKWTEKR